MNCRHLRSTLLLLFVLSLTGQAAAQLVPRLNLYSSYTDNLFQNYGRQSAWVTHAFVDLDYVSSAAVNLYYSGSAKVFAEYGDLFTHTHRTGVSYVRLERARDALYAGAELALRLDQPLYNYRDLLQADLYATAKRYLRPALLARAGYALGYREYLNARDYSFFEQTAFAQLSRFLPTRTTVQVRFELGLKTYAREVDRDATVVPARAGSDRNLVQLVSRFKVAQSLGSNTGLQLEYLHRANLAGQSRYTEEEFYNPDDDLFDDRYSYDGSQFRTTLKHLAGWGVQVEATGNAERRHYTGRPALDLEGFLLDPASTRQDTRKSLGLAAEKSFYVDQGWVREIQVQLEWLYRRIDSNDPYYRTDVQVYSTGIQIDF